MEYYRYGSIASLLKEGKQFNENEIREITSCVLLALNGLHNQSYIHGVLFLLLLHGIEPQTISLPPVS